MAKEKHQAKKLYIVVDENSDDYVKFCYVDNIQVESKDTFAELHNIEDESDFYFVIIQNFESTNKRKKTSFSIIDEDSNKVEGVECIGKADEVLGIESIFVKDARRLADKVKESVLSGVSEA